MPTMFFFWVINGSLLLATIIASFYFQSYSFGIYLNFLVLSLVLTLKIRRSNISDYIQYILLICSWLLIILGFGIITQQAIISDFLKSYYSASYDELLTRVILRMKPVGTFGTHSISAFFMFILFYLNLKTYKSLDKIIYLITAIVILFLLVFIRSTSSLLYLAISVFLLFELFAKRKLQSIVFISIIIAALGYFIIYSPKVLELLTDFDVDSILNSQGNGLSGRYSEKSVLRPTIDYILDNPFVPIGLTHSDDLYYTDSGLIQYVLRGSLLLFVGIYLGFYNFLKTNLLRKNNAYFLLFVVMLFELGYPISIYLRWLYFLPFLILYLNFLASNEKSRS